MKKAFTLIELLVVIAIIAILAAILFPVFAQAKEAAKKTAAISNMKQTATSFVIYSTDVDDNLPAQCSPNTSNGSWWWQYSSLYPAGWHVTADYPEVEDAQQWANSTFPYRKSLELLDISGTKEYKLFPATWYTDTTNPKKYSRHAFNFNGLLHTFPLSSVNSPSKCPLLTVGNGKISSLGDASSFPVMVCSQVGPCQFNGGGSPQGSGTGTFSARYSYDLNGTAWTFGQGSIFVATDTSAKFRRIGANTSATGSGEALNDPNSKYKVGGIPNGYYTCTPPGGGGSYDCFYRPDRPFDTGAW